MSKLNHPNICRLVEAYERRRHIYIVMEFCAGGNLSARVPMEETMAAVVCKKILLAVEYMHGKGVAHRDIKVSGQCQSSYVLDIVSSHILDIIISWRISCLIVVAKSNLLVRYIKLLLRAFCASSTSSTQRKVLYSLETVKTLDLQPHIYQKIT